MSGKPKTRVCSLYLTSQITQPSGAAGEAMPNASTVIPTNKSNLSAVSWLVNFDSLFNGIQRDYRRCMVRHTMNTTGFAVGAGDWNAYGGQLCATLPSPFTTNSFFGTSLGLYTSADTLVTTLHALGSNTMADVYGTEINVPSGVQSLTLYFCNDDAVSLITFPASGYQIILQFELMDLIE